MVTSAIKERVEDIQRRINRHSASLCGSYDRILTDRVSLDILGFSENPSWSATEVYKDGEFCIFVGGVYDAIDQSALLEREITAVVNCASLQSVHFRSKFPTSEMRLDLPLEDRPGFCLEEFLPEALNFLEKCRDERRNVLVHCMQGLNRSVAVIVAFLMEKMAVEEAVELVASRRPFVLSNRGFIAQLVRLQQRRARFFLSDS